MQLREAIFSAGKLEDDDVAPLTIYAFKVNGEWTSESPAVILNNSSDGPAEQALPPEYAGYSYFLELEIVEEAIDGLKLQRPEDNLDEDEIVKAVIYYAEYDSWPQ
jgi:hypothetical protein